MRASKIPSLPPRLDRARQRFQRWRRTRKIGTRIPESLWTTAVKLAETYGIHTTAKALNVDYYSLKKRLDQNSATPPGLGPVPAPSAGRFVELRSPAGRSIPECFLELEDAAGTKLRIQLKGIEAPDLAALGRSLWGGQ